MAVPAAARATEEKRETVGAGAGKGQLLEQLSEIPYGSRPFALAVSIKLYSSALAAAPRGLSENSQFLRRTTNDRIVCSQVLWSDRKERVIVVADQLRPLSQGERGRLAEPSST